MSGENGESIRSAGAQRRARISEGRSQSGRYKSVPPASRAYARIAA